MKTFKKLTAVLLVVMLTLTMCVTAFSAAAAEEEDTYWLAGSEGLTTPVWGGALAVPDYQLTANEDGIYSIVVPEVAEGKGYQFKIVKNGSEWIGDALGNNFTFDVTEACDVTITYDPATGEATYTGTGVGENVFSLDALYAVGNGDGEWLNGVAWNPGAAVNKMTETSTGVYELTMTGVPSYDNYQIKFAANGAWTDSWGIGDQGDMLGSGEVATLGEAFPACYNGENIIVKLGEYSEDEDGEEITDGKTWTVECVVDLTTYDTATKTGGTITITAIDESEPIIDPVDDTYWLAGSAGLTTPVWGGALAVEDYQLTANEDGTYVVVVPDVAEGKGYQFKIVKNGTEWIGIGEDYNDNVTFDVATACDVTITFNPATKEITYAGAGVVENVFSLDSLYAVGNGDGEWLNGVAWDPAAEENKMTETSENVYEFTMTGVPSYDNYQIKFAADGQWTNSWGIDDQGDKLGSGEIAPFGEAFPACYNGENLIVKLGEYSEDEDGEEVTDGKTWTVKCVVDLSAYDHSTKKGGTITITVEEESASDTTTIKVAAPVTVINGRKWTNVSLYYGSNQKFDVNTTYVPMTATNEVFYATQFGTTADNVFKAGAWKVYSVKLSAEQVAAIDAAKMVGFCTDNKQNRTNYASTRNIFAAGVNEFAATYGTKTSAANFDGYTFLIKDVTSATSPYTTFVGNWVTDFTTVKFAAPAANTLRSTWSAVDFFYGATAGKATTVPMTNTFETTKIDDIGDMTTLKVGRWYIYAVSLDPAQTAEANASKSVGFRKPGDTNTTSGSKSVLLAKTDEFDGTYNTTPRTLQELEGQVFVVEGRATATSQLTFLGEWQSEAKYTEGKDDTIKIYFAAPKGTSDTNDWATGVELYYGKTTVYKDTNRLAMTKVDGKTVASNAAGVPMTTTTLVAGNWDVYEVELTAELISAIDNSNNVGFIKKDSYNRTSILQTKSITRASNLLNDTSYSSASQTIEAYAGMTFVINGYFDAKNERTSYLGSWVLA